MVRGRPLGDGSPAPLRERLARLGVSGLDDTELLAMVLGTGDRGAPGLAGRLLARAGGLRRLPRARPGDLARVRGLGPARAARVAAAVELGRRTLAPGDDDRPRLASPRDLACHLLPGYGSAAVERFGLVMLDTRHRLIRVALVSVGSLDATIVHPREVFREAVLASAAAIVLFHNHPSGDPTPSADDLALTARLVRAGEVLGIEVVDHVILADERYCSLLEAGQLGRPGRGSDKMV